MNIAPPPPSNISPERLNQIAGRKLSVLGIIVRPGDDRRTLEGDYAFKTGQVQLPGTEQPIPRARFVVRGHDHLRFVDPPLSALGDVMFYDLDRPSALEERVAQQLSRRLKELDRPAAEMRRLKLPFKLDPQRLGLRTLVKTAQHTFELLAVPEETRVLRVEPLTGPPFDVSLEHPPLRLPDYRVLVDLELFLSNDVERMRRQTTPPATPARPRPAAPRVEQVPPERGQLTLGMLHRLGPDLILSAGQGVELVQAFEVGASRYHLHLAHESGSVFRATLRGPTGEVRSDAFDLSTFPGAAKLVATWLQAPQEPPETPHVLGPAVPPHLMPHPGEVWVMGVLIEEETADEVRYVCMDTDGKPYGAARILKRADFESTFVRHSNGWRLRILVDVVRGETILYRQLDGQRQPRGQPRRLAAGVLAATFLPEAAAY